MFGEFLLERMSAIPAIPLVSGRSTFYLAQNLRMSRVLGPKSQDVSGRLWLSSFLLVDSDEDHHWNYSASQATLNLSPSSSRSTHPTDNSPKTSSGLRGWSPESYAFGGFPWPLAMGPLGLRITGRFYNGGSVGKKSESVQGFVLGRGGCAFISFSKKILAVVLSTTILEFLLIVLFSSLFQVDVLRVHSKSPHFLAPCR